jgi:hypothetical protein
MFWNLAYAISDKTTLPAYPIGLHIKYLCRLFKVETCIYELIDYTFMLY